MNCFDIVNKYWNSDIIGFASKYALNLSKKLLPAVPSETNLGKVADYWHQRYGLPEQCQLVAATG